MIRLSCGQLISGSKMLRAKATESGRVAGLVSGAHDARPSSPATRRSANLVKRNRLTFDSGNELTADGDHTTSRTRGNSQYANRSFKASVSDTEVW